MEPRAVKKSIIINAHAPEVWKAITDPESIKKFLFGTEVKTNWKVGSPVEFTGSWKGREYLDKGKVLKFEKEKILEYTYWSSLSGKPDIPENYYRIIYELEEQDGQTVLSVTQTDIESQDEFDQCAQNWEMVLEKLKMIIENEVAANQAVS